MNTQYMNKIVEVLEQNGIYISDDWDEELEFDSITFISTIVCLEEAFDIDVPDDLLTLENFRTFKQYFNNIENIMLKTDSKSE